MNVKDLMNCTVDDVKLINKMLKALGLREFILDEDRGVVYQDSWQQFLGIGIMLKKEG